MSVRITKDRTTSNNKNAKLSAGTCGTVKAHCREGIYIDEDYITIVLRVKWGEDVLNWDNAHMQYWDNANMQSLVINEH